MGNEKIRIFKEDSIKFLKNEIALVGCECDECGSRWFPKRCVCPNCFGKSLYEKEISRYGEVYSYSILHVASKGFSVPLTIAYVDFPEGLRICGQIENGAQEKLKCAAKIEVVYGKIRDDPDDVPVYSYKFKTTKSEVI
jgi:uncharacterized OB-fold protein